MSEKYQHIINDMSSITDMIDRNLHQPDLYKKIDIFYYIQKGLEIKVLMNILKQPGNDSEDAQRDIALVHQAVMSKWKEDIEKLKPEKTAGWNNF